MKMSLVVVRWGHGLAASTTHACAVGGAPTGGGATVRCRAALWSRHRPHAGRQPCGRDAVETALGPGRTGRTPAAPVRGPGTPVERGPVGAAAATAPARRGGGRVRDRALDAAAHRPRGRADLRGPVRPQLVES